MKKYSIDKTVLEHESDEIGQGPDCVQVVLLSDLQQESDKVDVDPITDDEMVITKEQALGIYETLMPQWLNRESQYHEDIKRVLKQIRERFNL